MGCRENPTIFDDATATARKFADFSYSLKNSAQKVPLLTNEDASLSLQAQVSLNDLELEPLLSSAMTPEKDRISLVINHLLGAVMVSDNWFR